MVSFPAEILLGIYLGLLVGVVPALCCWVLAFAVRYRTGMAVPAVGALVVGVLLAGLNGALVMAADATVLPDLTVPRVASAALVVGALALYTHARGDEMGAEFPRRLSLAGLRERTLSGEAEFVDDGEEVRIRVVSEVADMDGHPPLPEELRAELRNAEVTLPADLRRGELERRVEERLRTEYDLGDVSVQVDDRGRAAVVAAPPFSGLSKRVAHDRHAVSVSGLIPTGLARGDEVTVLAPNAQVPGTVVSARTDDGDAEGPAEAAFQGDDSDEGGPVRTPTTAGGEGRLTVAVTRTDVKPLLAAETVKVVVEPRGTRREYEVVSLLRRAENRFRRIDVGADSPLEGVRLGDAKLNDRHDVSVLAVGRREDWLVAPDPDTVLEYGDELFAVGPREALDAVADVNGGRRP